MRISLTRILTRIFTRPTPAATPFLPAPTSYALFSRLVPPALLFAALALLMLTAAGPARAQTTQQPMPPAPVMPGAIPTPGAEPDLALRRMSEQMAARRNEDRQKKIVSDSARLLALAQQLNADISKSNKDTLSVPVVKEADEIEKLAKSIKDKMRDGE